MALVRNILPWLAAWAIVAGLAGPVAAKPVRDPTLPMQAAPGYEKARLIGRWFEVARSRSMLESDCHAVTADVETRDDSRLTLRIVCHKGSVTGPVLNIDGILVETDPGIFVIRMVRLQQFDALPLVVLWQAEDDSLAVLGTPGGQMGWVWSRSAEVDAATLALGREKLEAAGYAARAIAPVKQAP
ncbi:MAG: lipocalin family protein [Gemmobacter sp.]|jgi:apolipoprotein D and lipocalin family protein|nr:lipocalin family protein [Gemmobacter sp.]